jgi:UDP-N-acetylmuramoyl-L-alanyl-D-glutamate--2,6-diaminopimelate ligase
MVRDTRARVMRFGFGKSADYRASDRAVTSQGTNFILHTPDGRAEVNMVLIGKHNIENALAAAALVGETFGLSVNQIAAGLRDATGAPGRLQAVRLGQPFAVLVDYAHTDDALENVLTALRPLTRRKLRVVFGCGGDRDRTKRPRMARTAENFADALYVTSDNPRTEDPQSILDEIVGGLSAAGRAKAVVEIDRRAAIQQAIADAEEGDVVLIAGKGHENYQLLGKQKHHFDDVEEAIAAIQGRGIAA